MSLDEHGTNEIKTRRRARKTNAQNRKGNIY